MLNVVDSFIIYFYSHAILGELHNQMVISKLILCIILYLRCGRSLYLAISKQVL